MKIRISENKFIKIVEGEIRNALCGYSYMVRSRRNINENATERKRQEIAHNETLYVVRNFFKNGDWLDAIFEHQDNPERMTYLDYMVFHFEEEFFHAPRPSKPIIRLEPIVAQLAFDFGFQQQNPNASKLSELADIVTYIEKMAKLNKVEIPKIAQMQPKELFNTFIEAVKEEAERMRSETEGLKYSGMNQEYDIISDVNFKKANEIGNLSCPSGRLCYTQSKSTWDTYTQEGFNCVYVLLKKNYKDIPAEHNNVNEYDFLPENGYDEYGLSMIFLFVNPDGKLVYCNTRWNHNANYGKGKSVDHALNEGDISKIIGVNFYSVFNGNETIKKGIENALQRIANGENPEDVFECQGESDGLIKISYHNMINYLTKDGKLLSEDWFDFCGDFNEGVAMVSLNNKSNYITREGKYLSTIWFDNCSSKISDGFGIILRNNKFNAISINGHLLSRQWFDYMGNFNEGFSRVSLNGIYNFIDTHGKILSKEWFDDCGTFKNGIGIVKNKGLYNAISRNGNLISDEWFDCIDSFECGMARVVISGKYNFISQGGKLLSEKWFDDVGETVGGFAIVILDGKYNFISINGLLSKQWFDHCYEFSSNIAGVCLNDKWNYINKEGKIVFKQWFDSISLFYDGFSRVKLNNKMNVVTDDGKLVSKLWFDKLGPFLEGTAKVLLNKKENYINENGELISKIWFDIASFFNEGYSRVILSGKHNFIDKNGNLLSKRWFDSSSGFRNGYAVVIVDGRQFKISTTGDLYKIN